MVADKKHVPTAHIQLVPSVSYCGSDIYENDFAFIDGQHAVDVYATSGFLRACPTCVERYKDINPKVRAVPISLEGTRNDQ